MPNDEDTAAQEVENSCGTGVMGRSGYTLPPTGWGWPTSLDWLAGEGLPLTTGATRHIEAYIANRPGRAAATINHPA